MRARRVAFSCMTENRSRAHLIHDSCKCAHNHRLRLATCFLIESQSGKSWRSASSAWRVEYPRYLYMRCMRYMRAINRSKPCTPDICVRTDRLVRATWASRARAGCRESSPPLHLAVFPKPHTHTQKRAHCMVCFVMRTSKL